MLTPLAKNYRGLTLITGATQSGKSQLAEFLIKGQDSITYIATSKPRNNDPEWKRRISIHRKRRPHSWKLVEHPIDICKAIKSSGSNESILLDSLGGLVDQHLIKSEKEWENFQCKFLECIIENCSGIIIVAEEIGWGIVPATPIGHLFRERLSKLTSLISLNSSKKWLAINGTAIDLNKIGDVIP